MALGTEHRTEVAARVDEGASPGRPPRFRGRIDAPAVATFVAVAACVGVVLWALDPRDLFSTTLVTGGDTGAHVATAAFLRSHLLPHLHLTGWDPEWYDGFPLYTFYFPLPDALAAVLGLVMPWAVAFKLVTALGSLSLPVAAWAFGALAGLRRPRPAMLAAGSLLLLFDQSFQIYGGNLYSTMAGEYAFSLGLSLALVFLGLVVRGLRTGRGRGTAAVVLVACMLCHLVTAMFALAGAAVLVVLFVPWGRRLWWGVSAVATGLLLSAFWTVPFALEQQYTTNMGWTNVHTFLALFAPGGDRVELGVAALGLVVALVRRERVMITVGILGWGSYLAAVVDPQGKLYNTRFVPLWWIAVALLVGYAGAEVVVGVVVLARRLWAALAPDPDGPPPVRRAPAGVLGPLVGTLGALAVVLPPLMAPTIAADVGGASSVRSWAQWNYSGYQAKPSWPELEAVVAMTEGVAHRYGCGRAFWEYSGDPSDPGGDLNRFGTPMALMLLPMLTGECVLTQEGLLFESAGTTPFHFLDQNELSANPDDAMVGLDYGATDVELGVQHLQLLGVRYLLASSPEVQAQAAADPSLQLVGATGPWASNVSGVESSVTWKLYLVRSAALVAPLVDRPQVLTGVGDSQPSWLPVAQRWFLDPAAWQQELAQGGLPSWTRTAPGGRARGTPEALPPVAVSGIRAGLDTIRFHVDRVGVPVLVKVSYFPAWHVSGAKGPWRAEPNLMVVVPTSHEVTLTYGETPAGTLGLAGTVLGAVATVGMVVVDRGRRRRARA
jgi:hypothetical protein